MATISLIIQITSTFAINDQKLKLQKLSTDANPFNMSYSQFIFPENSSSLPLVTSVMVDKYQCTSYALYAYSKYMLD